MMKILWSWQKRSMFEMKSKHMAVGSTEII